MLYNPTCLSITQTYGLELWRATPPKQHYLIWVERIPQREEPKINRHLLIVGSG